MIIIFNIFIEQEGCKVGNWSTWQCFVASRAKSRKVHFEHFLLIRTLSASGKKKKSNISPPEYMLIHYNPYWFSPHVFWICDNSALNYLPWSCLMYVEKQINGVNKIIERTLKRTRLLEYFDSIIYINTPHVNYNWVLSIH